MANYGASRAFARWLQNHPGGGVIIYGSLLLVTLYGTLSCLKAYFAFPDKPANLAINQAFNPLNSNSQWVSLSGLEWRCADKLVEENSDGDELETIPLVSLDQKTLVLYEPRSGDHCENLQNGPVTGVLEPISDRRFNYLSDIDFDLFDKYERANIAVICAGCGPSDSMVGVLLCSGASLVLGAITFFCFRRWNRNDHSALGRM